MLGYIVFAVAFIGGSVAAFWDLRTTEVPDWVSYVLAGSGIVFHAVASLQSGNWWLLGESVLTGGLLFAFGWLMYLSGVWGGADAFVLGGTGFNVPILASAFAPVYVGQWPLGVTYIVNVFAVGTLYTICYAFYKGITDTGAVEMFFQDVRSSWARIAAIVSGFVVVVAGATFWMTGGFSVRLGVRLFQAVLALTGMLVLYRFLKVVESEVMVQRVAVEELEPGDVVAEDVETADGFVDSSKIVGLEEEQVEQIQRSTDSVLIKHGVMFVPSFPAALLVSVTFGDMIVFLVKSVL